MRKDTQQVLYELRSLRSDMTVGFTAMNARLDAFNARVDTLIDTLADLRRDFAEHEH